ncbi:MAG: hypothetical protein LBQ28_07880 [Prevotellaceae bacterium]|nr:hypothetical protein [Prevotellaceae bacterium]
MTILLIICTSQCKAQNNNNINDLVDALVDGYFYPSNDSITNGSKFLEIWKETIPYLIDAISTNKKGFLGFHDMLSSNINIGYTGQRSAYMIEYIISNSRNNIFNEGVIVKYIDKKMLHLSYEDMKEIKILYKKWWNKNKHKTIEELSEDWHNNKRPLTGSVYKWK